MKVKIVCAPSTSSLERLINEFIGTLNNQSSVSVQMGFEVGMYYALITYGSR